MIPCQSFKLSFWGLSIAGFEPQLFPWNDGILPLCYQSSPDFYVKKMHGSAYLFPTIWWQIEHKHREERDAHTRDDQVDRVEQRFPPHCHIEGDVKVGLITARVEFDISYGGHLQDVPLHRHVELGQVHADVDLGAAVLLVNVAEVDLERVEEKLKSASKAVAIN